MFAASLLILGLFLLPVAPAQAQGWWWNHHDRDDVTVTVHAYIDGALATETSADDAAFPMSASWTDDGEEGSDTFELSADGSYSMTTEKFEKGADYQVSESLDGDAVGASCDGGHPFALAGYTTGASVEAAADGALSKTSPAFANLSADQHVIVWNETCDDGSGNGGEAPSGSLDGEVTGGTSDEKPGDLEVTSIDAEKTTAVANGEFADGWRYVFNVTVPADEAELAMKFDDWLHSGGEHTLPVAGNMRISSDQADNDGAAVTLDAADTYSSPTLTMTGDLDEDADGLQVQVAVEVAVPEGTYNGTYSTSYGVQTN